MLSTAKSANVRLINLLLTVP